MADDQATELRRFLQGEIDPAGFRHVDHVRLAFALLRQAPFLEAAPRYAAALRLMAARAGRPRHYHETKTVGFLALVGERLALSDASDFDAFARTNGDLLLKSALERWYGPDRLNSPLARGTFILPEPRP